MVGGGRDRGQAAAEENRSEVNYFRVGSIVE